MTVTSFRWMEVYPEKIDGTHLIMRYEAVYRPFIRGLPPSTERLLQSFLNYTLSDKIYIRCYLNKICSFSQKSVALAHRSNIIYSIWSTKILYVWFIEL